MNYESLSVVMTTRFDDINGPLGEVVSGSAPDTYIPAAAGTWAVSGDDVVKTASGMVAMLSGGVATAAYPSRYPMRVVIPTVESLFPSYAEYIAYRDAHPEMRGVGVFMQLPVKAFLPSGTAIGADEALLPHTIKLHSGLGPDRKTITIRLVISTAMAYPGRSDVRLLTISSSSDCGYYSGTQNSLLEGLLDTYLYDNTVSLNVKVYVDRGSLVVSVNQVYSSGYEGPTNWISPQTDGLTPFLELSDFELSVNDVWSPVSVSVEGYVPDDAIAPSVDPVGDVSVQPPATTASAVSYEINMGDIVAQAPLCIVTCGDLPPNECLATAPSPAILCTPYASLLLLENFNPEEGGLDSRISQQPLYGKRPDIGEYVWAEYDPNNSGGAPSYSPLYDGVNATMQITDNRVDNNVPLVADSVFRLYGNVTIPDHTEFRIFATPSATEYPSYGLVIQSARLQPTENPEIFYVDLTISMASLQLEGNPGGAVSLIGQSISLTARYGSVSYDLTFRGTTVELLARYDFDIYFPERTAESRVSAIYPNSGEFESIGSVTLAASNNTPFEGRFSLQVGETYRTAASDAFTSIESLYGEKSGVGSWRWNGYTHSTPVIQYGQARVDYPGVGWCNSYYAAPLPDTPIGSADGGLVFESVVILSTDDSLDLTVGATFPYLGYSAYLGVIFNFDADADGFFVDCESPEDEWPQLFIPNPMGEPVNVKLMLSGSVLTYLVGGETSTTILPEAATSVDYVYVGSSGTSKVEFISLGTGGVELKPPDADIRAPSPTVLIEGTVLSDSFITVSSTRPTAILTGSSLGMHLSSPSPTVAMRGVSGWGVQVAPPTPAVEATGSYPGASIICPPPVVSIEALSFATVYLTCPRPTSKSYSGATISAAAPKPVVTMDATAVAVTLPWGVVLSDSFTSPGPIPGKYPDVGDYAWGADFDAAWSTWYQASVVDGYLVCPDSSLPGNYGFACYPASRYMGFSAIGGFVLDLVVNVAGNPYNTRSLQVDVIDVATQGHVSVSIDNMYDDLDEDRVGPLTTWLTIAAYSAVGSIAVDKIDIASPDGGDLRLLWVYTGTTHTVSFGGGSVSSSPPVQLDRVDAIELLVATTASIASINLSPPVALGVNATPPLPTVDIRGAGLALNVTAVTAPLPTLHFTAHDSTGENAITATAPGQTVTFNTGATIKAKAPSPKVSATGTVTNWASAAISAPSPKVSTSATVSGMASITAKAPSPNLIGYGGAVCSVTLTGRPTVKATATTGSVASIAITCPLFQVTASATAQNHGSLHVIAPSPRMGNTMQAWVTAPMAKLTIIGSAVVTATYEAYAINLNHVPVRGVEPVDEVTRYTNFPFTHVVRYKNSYYGANSTGLYLLEGTTDDEAPIEFAVKTAMTDFDSPLKKTVVSAYFAGRLGSQTTIDLHVGEDGAKPYSHTTVRGEHAQNYRQKFGRGTDARYYAIGASGTGTIELDSIELMVQTSKRRI